ncbi:MAG: trypsin-like peptidase domain-containing protein [Nitrospinae bacterium]|nr:trypsin-like peptidase domain-containing protein [Nitrospinota bacterium]
MKSKNRLFAHSAVKYITPFILGFLAFALNSCSTSPSQKNTVPTLVTADAPIFDKRFREISFQDLNLENFWAENETQETREPIPINNNTFADLTDKVKDGVVNIYTLRLEERTIKFGISPNDLLPIKIPILSTIFEIIPFQVPIPFQSQGMSLGSGFIINEQGYILTNAHVVLNALDIQVLLSDGKKAYPAKIIGIDRLTDTALLKIEPDRQLTVLPLGDSDKLRMGEMVLAIGNPLGLRHTVTSGIISAKERVSPQANDKFAFFIQTDSAINPGSSGGPLINLYGEVVGINTAIVSQAQLIGFSIPANTVKEVMPLLVLGHAERGWFGLKAIPLSIEEAVELNYNGEDALVIEEVEKGSPAEKSGLKPKDIIVKFDGQPMKKFLVFRRKLLGLMPGKQIRMTIWRNGEEQEITSTLVKREPLEDQPGF